MSYRISERRACRVTRLHRGTYRYRSLKNPWTVLRMRIREIAQARVRYGYRKILVLLNREGWEVGKTLVQRLYQEEGLVLKQRPKRRRRAAEHRGERVRTTEVNQAWSLDFVADQLTDGRRFRALTIVDVFTRESLAIEVGPALKGTDVVEVLNRLRFKRSVPSKDRFQPTGETNRQRLHRNLQRDAPSGVPGHALVRNPGGSAGEYRGLAPGI
jgi:putative transposase